MANRHGAPKQLVIGIGTGRCGTVSLCTVLGQQADSDITHEQLPLLPWEKNQRLLEKKISRICSRKSGRVGDVASYWLPYVRDILQLHPDARIICLQRNRDETINSFLAKTKGKYNHWMQYEKHQWKKSRKWDPCFPKLAAGDIETALGMYWDEYYAEVEKLIVEFPDNCRLWDMHAALNTSAGLAALLSFIGLSEPEQSIHTGIQENRFGTRPKIKNSFLQKILQHVPILK